MDPSRSSIALSRNFRAEHAAARLRADAGALSSDIAPPDSDAVATVLRATARAARALARSDCAIAAAEIRDGARTRVVVECVGLASPLPESWMRNAVSTIPSSGVPPFVAKRRRQHLLQRLARAGFQSAAAADLRIAGLSGCIMVASVAPDALSLAAVELEGIGRCASLFFEEVSSEARRIARELHDTLGHTLTCLLMTSDQLTRRCAGSDRRRLAQTVRSYGQRAMSDVRALIDLTTTGRYADRDPERVIAEVLRRLSALGVATRYSSSVDLAMLPSSTARCVGTIAAEALMNVLRHARARTVDVRIGRDGDEVELIVADDGVGFVVDPLPSTGRRGFGVRSMRERAQESRGTLTIKSTPGGGTTVTVRIPVA